MGKELYVSKRTRLGLSSDEISLLKKYTDNLGNMPFANIKANTGIAYDTVQAILTTGFAERDVAYKMRDFLKLLKASNINS